MRYLVHHRSIAAQARPLRVWNGFFPPETDAPRRYLEIAAQVPARIIADILGIPRGDLPVFMQWIADTAEALGFINLDRRHEIEKSLVAFNDYVAALLADRHSSPREDFLSEYVVATAQDGELSEDEIRTEIVGLILAGSDTVPWLWPIAARPSLQTKLS